MTDAKKEEWYQWGKDGYKSNASMMKTNCHHPDYDTLEKREAQHDTYRGWQLEPERLTKQFKYTKDDIAEAAKQYRAGYDVSRKWYKKADKKYQIVIDKYQPIFTEVEEALKLVDVSDISDGFPCGSAHLYLQYYGEGEDLYQALGHFNGGKSSTEAYTRKLPIKFPPINAQCVRFEERYCKIATELLRAKGVFASTYSWID